MRERDRAGMELLDGLTLIASQAAAAIPRNLREKLRGMHVLMVDNDEAMKSASRPGSVMLTASDCKSSDMSGDIETICWKLVLMFRWRASISSRSDSSSTSGASLTAPRRYGRTATSASRRTRASPCTMMRRLPSGSLNILWMWVRVPMP